jgi:hypothetical protein
MLVEWKVVIVTFFFLKEEAFRSTGYPQLSILYMTDAHSSGVLAAKHIRATLRVDRKA